MAKRLQLRRDTESNWVSNNPVLALGELGYATDTDVLKIGDGSTSWNSLDYFVPQSTDDVNEGSTNLYFTNARAISATISNVASASAYALSQAQIYADALDTDDIDEGVSNLYFTNPRALSATESTISSASANAVSVANAYADSQVTSLIDAAPSSLNTLNELAAALNDDPNFYSTVQGQLDLKLAISSASSTYLTIANASTTYDTLGSADAAQSAATGYTQTSINNLDTDDIEEGISNLYFTNQRALDATLSTITSASAAAASYADSLDTDDISEGTSNLYFTNQRALDATVATISSASANSASVSNQYTDLQISLVIDSAPSGLNTLNEIAAAINDDPNYYVTVNNAIGEKIDISSASSLYLTQVAASNIYLSQLSASSLYVTQAEFNNAVEIASASASPLEINSQSASYTLHVDDFGKMIEMSLSSSATLTIPNDSSMAVGFYFNVTQTGTGSIYVEPAGGVTIYAEDNDTVLFSQYSSAYMYKRSPSEWVFIKSKPSLVLKSANNTLFQISVDNDGSLITEVV